MFLPVYLFIFFGYYLSCHQDPDQQMDNVEFTDFRLQGNAAPNMTDGHTVRHKTTRLRVIKLIDAFIINSANSHLTIKY